MKIQKLLIIFVFIVNVAYSQQEAHYTQYIFNHIHLNPAYAGYKEDIYLQSFYRAQWTGLDGAPKSLSLAADGAVNNNKVGLSLLINSDKIGVQNHTSAYFGYAYRLNTNANETSRLSFGLSLGFMQSSLQGNLLVSDEIGDSYVPVSRQSALLPDARAGVLFTSDYFFTGFSANNIFAAGFSNKDSETRGLTPKPHLYLTAGSLIPVGEDLKVKPVFLLKDDLGGPTNLDINTFVLIKEKIWVGAMYRTAVKLYNKDHLQKELFTGSATGLMLELFARKDIRIGYSFDYSLNKLKSYNNGTHEISIGIYLKGNSKFNQKNSCYF